MSCYTRHLGEVLKELGRADTKEERRKLDREIRAALDEKEADCPQVWKKVKELLHDQGKKKRLIDELKKSA